MNNLNAKAALQMIELNKMTLREALDNSARKHPDSPALAMLDKYTLTYAELHNKVESLRKWLLDHGIVPGDRIAILAENSPHWGLAFFAITGMGAIAVPILTEFHQDAITHILRHSESKILFVSERLISKIPYEDSFSVPLCINIDSFEPINFENFENVNSSFAGVFSAGIKEFDRLKELAKKKMHSFTSGDDSEENIPSEDDVASIIYTSGTTGHSKGVVLTHKNILSDVLAIINYIVPARHNDRLLSILPLPHSYECNVGLVAPIVCGASVTYIDKPPSARVLLPALNKVKPTAVLSVPLVIEKIYKSSIYPKLSSSFLLRFLMKIQPIRKFLHKRAGVKLMETFGGKLEYFAIGGAPLSRNVELFLSEAKFPYLIGYGLTETAPLSSVTSLGQNTLYSAGKPLHGVELKIDNKNAQGDGEILIKGPNVMREYYLAPDITKEVFTEDGFFRSGDLGRIDKDGYLFIRGRIKNVIIGSSGENIYPEEIESIILRSPYVLEAIVLLHNAKLSARVHLDYVYFEQEHGNLSDKESKITIATLLEQLRRETNEQVSSFAKLHQMIEQPDPFEKTPTQKIKRYLYTEQ